MSLGNAANRPAKHLYAQLSLPEENRALKKYFLGVRDENSGRWIHTPLSQLPEYKHRRFKIAASVANENFGISLTSPTEATRRISAMAAPIGQPGSDGAPSAEQPGVFFGWIMRADLDGFTQRVQECIDNEQALIDLGRKFLRLMDAAATFTEAHAEYMVQLPWAGDNFTAAVVFNGKRQYDNGRPNRLVEHALDFDDEMKESVDLSGFKGWAFGVGGADIHGNAAGNVFIGSVEFDDRRFLVGAGQGFARSLQAFADLKPDADQMAVFVEDYAMLDPVYKCHFEIPQKTDGTLSTLFRISDQSDLQYKRLKQQASNRKIPISAPGVGSVSIPSKPYAHE